MTLNTLFKELTGTPLATPEDPSRDTYWQTHDPDYHARKAREAAAAEQQHQQANARAEQQQRQKEQRDAQKQQKQQEKQQRQEQARQAREQEQHRQQERERQRQREHTEREQQRSRRQDSHQQGSQERRNNDSRQQRTSPPPPDRTTRALSILGLTPGATRIEVRHAYRRMAQLHHPDRFYSESEHQVALASARFQRIKNAYDYLMQTY